MSGVETTRAGAAGWMLAAILLLAGSLAAFQGAGSAFACSCAQPGSPQEELDRASAVFSGRVLSVTGDDFGMVATFDADRKWKGDGLAGGRTVKVSTAASGDACGYPFEEGPWYLVYTHGDDNDVSLCSRTALFSEAGDDIRALGEGQIPAAQATSTPAVMTPDPPYNREIVLLGLVALVGAIGAAAAAGSIYFVKRKRKKRKDDGSS